MKTIKFYECKCGEDFYEDDEVCINCGVEVDESKFVVQKLHTITQIGPVEKVEMPLIPKK